MLEKAISKNALAKIDIFRRQRGIRTRRQALEVLLEEAVPEHPLTVKLRTARVSKDPVPKEVRKAILERRAGKGEYFSHEEIKAMLEARKRGIIIEPNDASHVQRN